MAQTRSSRFHKFARSRIGLPLADVILVYGYEMLAETGGVRVLLITTLLCANVPGVVLGGQHIKNDGIYDRYK